MLTFTALLSFPAVFPAQAFNPSQMVVQELEAMMRMLFSKNMCGFGDTKVRFNYCGQLKIVDGWSCWMVCVMVGLVLWVGSVVYLMGLMELTD